jgi:hypothetical protein
MTRNELVQMLLDVQHATFITFTARTEVDCRVKDKDKNPNPFVRPIWKTNRVNGMVCFWYDAAVLRRLEKEGKSADCFRQGTSWHTPVFISGRLTALCQSKNVDNGKMYVRFKHENSCGEATYTDDNGCPIMKEQLTPFLPTKNNYVNQGLDEPIKILTYNIDGILEISMNGNVYTISEETQTAVA